jgi:histidyl-tRNA synthetase
MNVSHPVCDVHVIEMASTVLEQLQISNYSLQINSLGDELSRSTFRKVLETYLNKYKDSLSPLSRSRLERGSVLRVLDSKEKEDELVVRDAPALRDHLTPESSKRFSEVIAGLDALGLNYTINPRLVRGLDYYNDTCFEFVTGDGSPSPGQAIIAGGRYDKLSEIMGGQSKPGVGWASGIERLSLLLSESILPKQPRPIAIIPVSESSEMDGMWTFSMQLAHSLRASGVPALLSYENTPAKHTKKASKENCRYCVYIGSDELLKGTVIVKDMDTSKQFECSVDQLRSMFPMYTKE